MNKAKYTIVVLCLQILFAAPSVLLGQENTVRNRLMLFVNNQCISADSLIENFNFYYFNDQTVAGMVDVPTPVMAKVWRDYYFDEKNQRIEHDHAICLQHSSETDTLHHLAIEEKKTKRAVYIFNPNDIDQSAYCILRIPFKLGSFQAIELGHTNLLDDPTLYLKDVQLTKRSAHYRKLSQSESEALISNKSYRIDTLCNNEKYVAYKAKILTIRNISDPNDSVRFIVRLQTPKRYQRLEVQHLLTYVPIDALDTEPQLALQFVFSGRTSKKQNVQTYLVSIPPIQKDGNYWVNISCVFDQNQISPIAHHAYLGCPMILDIDLPK